MACPVRRYPSKKPPKWKPPVPRWQLVLPEDVLAIYTLYIGVQSHHSPPPPAFATAITTISSHLHTPSTAPSVIDTFTIETGHDIPGTRVWVCYWTSQNLFSKALSTLNLLDIYSSLPSSDRSKIGLWTESFTTPVPRLETNYAGLHEAPGLARLPNSKREGHELSAYWGAARDRMPASAEDVFELPGTKPPSPAGYDPEDSKTHPTERLQTTSDAAEIQMPAKEDVPRGFGQRLSGWGMIIWCILGRGNAGTNAQQMKRRLMRRSCRRV